MELIGSLFLILALAVIVALFVARPFFERMAARSQAGSQSEAVDHRRSALMAEHDRILNALQELEFDASLGKVPAEDYPEQRMALLKKGAVVLRQLDEMQGLEQGRDTAEERIAAAVAARRADGATRAQAAREAVNAPVAAVEAAANGNGRKEKAARDAVEDMIASKRRAREEKSAGFCPRCGRPVQKSDKFCARCGATL